MFRPGSDSFGTPLLAPPKSCTLRGRERVDRPSLVLLQDARLVPATEPDDGASADREDLPGDT